MSGVESSGYLTVAAKLRDLMPQFTPSERRVARALLTNYPVAGLSTVADLASLARVSSPTVLRLLGRLGFTSFAEFQRVLRDELHERLATVADSFHPDADEAGDFVSATLHAAMSNLAADVESITGSELEAAVDALRRARHVLLAGGTTSHATAYYLYLLLDMVRPGCRFLGATASPAWTYLADLRQRDLVVLFDFRSYEVNTLEIARWAKAHGARVMLFTDPWLSPVASLASHVLVTHDDSPSPFGTSVSATAFAEAVAADVALRLGDKVRRRLETTERLLGAAACRLTDGEPGQ
jgi:DNA-binding MurR/RpiR family transcriptional regulator